MEYKVFGEEITRAARALERPEEFERVDALLEDGARPGLLSVREKLGWLDRLFAYVRGPAGTRHLCRVRLDELFAHLRAEPRFQDALGSALRSALSETGLADLLARRGLPASPSLLGETMRRLALRLDGFPPSGCDLGQWIAWAFADGESGRWLSDLSDDEISEILWWIRQDAKASAPSCEIDRKHFRQATLSALGELSDEITELGLCEELRFRTLSSEIADSACIRLGHELDQFCLSASVALPGREDLAILNEAAASAFAAIATCQEMINTVEGRLDEFGVAPGLVYRLDRLQAMLARTAILLDAYLIRLTGELTVTDARRILLHFTHGVSVETELSVLYARALGMLARKVVDRKALSGERFVARTRQELLKVLGLSGGGGVITSFSAVAKLVIGMVKFPVALCGMLFSLNYSLAFLIMHAFNFKLASKQPSMLASSLVARLKSWDGHAVTAIKAFAQELAATSRSLIAAVVGNIGAVIPAGIAFHFVYLLCARGHAFMSPESARHTLESLNPLQSLTVPYAMLTGALLWLAGVLGAWMENRSFYRSIPLLLRKGTRWIGAERSRKLSASISRHSPGITSSVVLGTLLGSTPMLGSFIGLPLDVRHLTFSSGSLSLAVCTLGISAATLPAILAACAGIVCIVVANISVAFSIGFMTALHAQGVDRALARRMFGAIRSEARKLAWAFVIPPKAEIPLIGEVAL